MKQIIKHTDSIFNWLTIIIAIIGLSGWIFGELIFAKVFPLYIPIAPSTSVSFVFLAIISIVLKKSKEKRYLKYFQLVISILSIFFIYVIVEWIFGLNWDLESVFISSPDSFGVVKTGRMSPLTATLFIIEFSSLILIYSKINKIRSRLIWITIILSLYVSTILIIGYIYNEPLLYGGTIIPVALPTAVCFWFISIAQLYFVSSNKITISFKVINETSRRLIAVFLPFVIIVVFITGFLHSINFKLSNEVLHWSLLMLILLPTIVLLIISISRKLGISLENANELLQRTTTELRKVQKISHIGSWYLDLKTNEVIWTEELYKMYGFDPLKPVPPYTEHKKLFTKESWDLLSKSLANTAKTGIPYELELNMIRKDGSKGWMWVRGESVTDENGNNTGMWGAAQDITTQKLVELKVKESYNLLNNLTSMVPGVVYQYQLFPDGSSCFPYSSPGMFEIYEVSPEEVKEDASPVFTRIHPDDYDFIVETINESAKNLTVYHSEYRVVLPKQGLRWRLCDAKPQRLDDGSILWHGIITDITERKKVEKEILDAKLEAEESEQKLKLIANSLVDGMIYQVAMLDEDNRKFNYVSDAVTKLYGCTPEEALEDPMLIYGKAHKDDIEGFIKAEKLALKNMSVFKKECRVINPDGSIRWSYYISQPRIINGITCWDGIEIDITKQKKIESDLTNAKEKAEENEIQLHSILENSPTGFAINRISTGKVTYVNHAFAEAYHIPYELCNDVTTFFEYVYGDQMELGNKILSDLNSGDTKRMKWDLVPIKDKKTNKIHYITASNIILQKHDLMISTVLDITSQVENEKELKYAKEKAEESDRLKSAFLANMSHEIRTPMNGILGFTNLLQQPNLSGKQQAKYIDIIKKSGDRMLNTVNDIIDISRIEAGLESFNVSEVNVNEQLKYYYSFFKPEASKKSIKLRLNNDSSVKACTIKTDFDKFDSVMINLIKNAIKYTDDGTIEFGYSIKTERKKEYIEFYVKDSGIGIPLKRQEAIFDRFVQADIEDKQAKQGSGLGLAITKAYVEMMGGKIWVESEEGAGSVFYFAIDYNKVNTKSIENKSVEKYKQNEEKLSGKLNILVVEDDEISDRYISLIIKDFAYKITSVDTGEKALEECRKNPDIDLILMDIQLPDMNGYEATREIRKFNNSVIIIAQTAYAMTGDRARTIEAGCNEYLSKPIDQKELELLINKYSRKE